MAVAVALILAGNDLGLAGVSWPFLAAFNLVHVKTGLQQSDLVMRTFVDR